MNAQLTHITVIQMPHVVIHTDLLLVLVILDTQGMESRALVVFYSILSYWLNSFDMYKLFEGICNIGVYRMVKISKL